MTLPRSLRRIAKQPAQLKVLAPVVNGKRSSTPPVLYDVMITPPVPAINNANEDPTKLRKELEAPFELMQIITGDTELTLLPVRKGDFVVVGTKDYSIVSIESWPWLDGYRFRLLCEEVFK